MLYTLWLGIIHFVTVIVNYPLEIKHGLKIPKVCSWEHQQQMINGCLELGKSSNSMDDTG